MNLCLMGVHILRMTLAYELRTIFVVFDSAYLQVPDIILRPVQTCKHLHGLTYDKSPWISLYLAQARQPRFPTLLHTPPSLLDGCTQSEVESLVLSTHLTERRWL